MATLAELKAENAAEKEETLTSAIDSESIETEEGAEPFWMAEEAASEETDEAEETETGEESHVEKPVSALVKLKRKLKGKIGEQTSEIEQLKAKIEALERQVPQTATTVTAPKRPRSIDFDTDEDYENALDKYEEEKLQYQMQHISTTQKQAETVDQRIRAIAEGVDKHYDRAAKLIVEYGIKPEVYQYADAKVKSIIDSVLPGQGESVFNALVEKLGEGSEKIFFHIGRIQAAQDTFLSKLHSDPSGISLALYLGELKKEIKGTKNQLSKAPAPSAQLRGDDVSTAKGSALKRKYEEASKKGNAQEAYNLKKEARKAGLDTSTWR